MEIKDKKINFSISRNLFTLGVAIAGAFLVIVACMIVRGSHHYSHRQMMRGGDESKWGHKRDMRGDMMLEQKRQPDSVDVIQASTSAR